MNVTAVIEPIPADGCDGAAMARTLVAESLAVCARKIGAAPPPPLPLRDTGDE